MTGVRVKEGESFENAMKRFKKQCEKAGILSEIRKREHYEKPSVKRKKKAIAAKKRAMKKSLLLPLHAGLLVVLALAHLGEDPGLLASLLETLHGVLEGLTLLDSYSRHAFLARYDRMGSLERRGAGRRPTRLGLG